MNKFVKSKRCAAIAAVLSALSISYANAATTVLAIGGVDSGWIAQHSDDTTVTVLSIDPVEANIEINVSGAITPSETKEAIVLKQVSPKGEFGDETFFWIRSLSLNNSSGKDWTRFEIRAIDGSRRGVSADEHDEHPDAAHIHAMTPIDDDILLSQATNGLVLSKNRIPFTKFTLSPYGYPCDPNCSLGVGKVTLSGGVVHNMEMFNPKNIRLHVKKHEMEIRGREINDTSMIVHFTPNP